MIDLDGHIMGTIQAQSRHISHLFNRLKLQTRSTKHS